MHTHLLALGMLFFLVILALEKAFTLSDSRWFTPFFWIYNAGLVLTVTMLTVHGNRRAGTHPAHHRPGAALPRTAPQSESDRNAAAH